MTENYLPEDITLKIIQRLPLKAVVRFSTVSKRWYSIISADPQFKKPYMEQQPLRRRLLVSSASRVESLDLETPSFRDSCSVRNISIPFKKTGNFIKLVGSCNGLVCVALESHPNLYIWNPSNGFFQKLPDPCFSHEHNSSKIYPDYSCFGHSSATDDYKVCLSNSGAWTNELEETKVFSQRSKSWKNIEHPPDLCLLKGQGTLFNEAVHSLHYYPNPSGDILVFDLTKEEFSLMPLPHRLVESYGFFFKDLGVSGGCLCLTCEVGDSIDLWVMREYGVPESWTKLFNYRIADELSRSLSGSSTAIISTMVMEGTLFVYKEGWNIDSLILKVDHIEGTLGHYMFPKEMIKLNMIQYEETPLWLGGYHSSSERRSEEGQKTQDQSYGITQLK